jgi:hypothetical protein
MTDNDIEKEVAELARIERLKNPSPFYPTETPEERAAWKDRVDDLKAKASQPTRLPPKPAPDLEAQIRERLERERLHERLKGL